MSEPSVDSRCALVSGALRMPGRASGVPGALTARRPGALRVWKWLSVVVALLLAPLAVAQGTYPNKSIRLVAPFTPGGGVDTVARIIGQKLSANLGQAVVIDNRVGAGGSIGADFVAKSAPDGYTLLANFGPPHHVINLFTRNVPYDPVHDFTPIAIVGTAPQVIVISPNLPVTTLGELISYGQAHPGALAYGTSGVGSSQHIAGLMLAALGNMELTHVAYKGGAAALNDVLGGQIPMGILVLSNVLPHTRSGKVRALGVVESHRARMAPGIPTVAEGGLAGFAVPDTWAGILGPAGMPAPIVQRLNAELLRAVETPEVQSRLEAAGFQPGGSTPEVFADLITGSVEVYRSIVARSNIRPE